MSLRDLKRFQRYTRLDASGCLLWTGALGADGYGSFRLHGRPIPAHRAGYELLGEKRIPDGLQLDHLCRVRACVNPTHLEPVTSAENTRRGAGALLTKEKAAEIWLLKRQKTGREVARQFGVSESLVSLIWRRCRWYPVAEQLAASLTTLRRAEVLR